MPNQIDLTQQVQGILPIANGGTGTNLGAVLSLGSVPVVVEEHLAGNSLELDFTSWFSAAFDDYLIEIVNLVPVNNAVQIQLQFSTNGGVSYDIGSNYVYSALRWTSAASAAGGSTGTTSIGLDGGGGSDLVTNTAANGGLNGTYRLFGPGSAAFKFLRGETAFLNSAGAYDGASVAAAYKVTSVVNAFRILASSGNLASGVVRVYGMPKHPIIAEEDYWQNPTAPVPATLQWVQQWPFDVQEPAGKLFGTAEEDYWQNPVAPVPATLQWPQQWSFDVQEPAGRLFGQLDEDYWLNLTSGQASQPQQPNFDDAALL